MNYYNTEQTVILKGIFKEYSNGAFSFELENKDIIDFEEVNKDLLLKYDLKSNTFKNKIFLITYKEIFDDLDEDDFVVFKLENLELL